MFNQVRLDLEVHTLVWPGNSDFDPATLYNWYPGEAAELVKRAARWQDVDIIKTANEYFDYIIDLTVKRVSCA